jgi:hypothetical protein
MSRLLITLLFFFISLFISNELKSEVQGLRLAKEYNKLTTLDLLDEGLFDLVQSGLTTIDFTKVRQQLLAIQSDIYIYSKQQQAFYWYKLYYTLKEPYPSVQILIASSILKSSLKPLIY